MGGEAEGDLLPVFAGRCNVSSRLRCVAGTELGVGVLPGEQHSKTEMVLKSCGSFLVVGLFVCFYGWLVLEVAKEFGCNFPQNRNDGNSA